MKKCGENWVSVLRSLFCHAEAESTLCSLDYREPTAGNFWECSVIKPFWLEFHKTVKYNYYVNLLLQFATIFPGNVDLQARGTEKYMFGLRISACSRSSSAYFKSHLFNKASDQTWFCIDDSMFVSSCYAIQHHLSYLYIRQYLLEQLKCTAQSVTL